MPSKVEVEVIRRFGERYRVEAPVALAVERAVLGSDYGANGFTTVAQANMLAEALALREGRRLLDIGSGCGWPGLYMAKQTGCEVVITDMPLEGMRRALRRSRDEGLAPRSAALVATGRRLPFRAGSFDAIVHTDVLC
jgi:protein-L-isoaspartate O-methyltransferase